MTRTNIFLTLAASMVALAAAPMPASAGEVTGDLTVASSYVFPRFAVEVSGEPVVQPSINWEVTDTLSANVWASSNVDEVFTNPFGNAGSEVDITVTKSIGNETSVTVGRYIYPGSGDWSAGDWMVELDKSVGRNQFTVSGYWGASDTVVLTARRSYGFRFPAGIARGVELRPGLSYETREQRLIAHLEAEMPITDRFSLSGILSSSEGTTVGSIRASASF